MKGVSKKHSFEYTYKCWKSITFRSETKIPQQEKTILSDEENGRDGEYREVNSNSKEGSYMCKSNLSHRNIISKPILPIDPIKFSKIFHSLAY